MLVTLMALIRLSIWHIIAETMVQHVNAWQQIFYVMQVAYIQRPPQPSHLAGGSDPAGPAHT